MTPSSPILTGQTTSPDGATISYCVGGQGPRRMVFIPGAGDGLATAAQASRRLRWWMRSREAYFQVLYVSRREQLLATTSFEQQARDVATVMEHLNWGPCQIEAQSAGGPIAQQLASLRPDLVASLVLSSSAAWLDANAHAQFLIWLDLIGRDQWGAFFESVAPLFWRDARLLAMRPFRSLLHQATSPQDPARLAHIISSLLDLNQRALLSEISAPTLVIGGADDQVFSETLQSEMAAHIPGATLSLHAGFGHGHDLENPAHIQRVAAFARLHVPRCSAPITSVA